jgi:secreted PhoX family phosphatase
MLNNCAGGKTLWGTVLTAEENWNQYFANNDALTNESLKDVNSRYGVPGGASERLWEVHHPRFDVSEEPNEINRFGFVVEIDPYNPNSTPKKRTSLGRFKHEAATVALARDGRVVVYTGDDERFEYAYKFVTSRAYDPSARQANFDILDEGTLYVARFDDDGTGEWIPLRPGQGALAGWTLARILHDTRGAADAVGATPMDRPEDIEVNPWNNRVYVALTNNSRRTADDLNGPNPRAENAWGQILELSERGGDLGATRFQWEIFLLCGEPSDPSTYFAGFNKDQVSPIGCPDNVLFDNFGNLWIDTDGQPSSIKKNDSLMAVPTAGPDRGKVQAFLNAPPGAEVTGAEFTPDNQAVFVNIQHPGEAGEGPDNPQSLWPDGVWPALPSLVVVTKIGGGRIGT